MAATLLKTLGVILGHTRIAVTLEVCSATDADSGRDAVGKLASYSDPKLPHGRCHICCIWPVERGTEPCPSRSGRCWE